MLTGVTATAHFITILNMHHKDPHSKDYVVLKEAAKAAHQAGDLSAYYKLACLFDERNDVLNAFHYFYAVPKRSPYYQEAQSWVYEAAIQDDKLFCKILSSKLTLVQSEREDQPELICRALTFSHSNSPSSESLTDNERNPKFSPKS